MKKEDGGTRVQKSTSGKEWKGEGGRGKGKGRWERPMECRRTRTTRGEKVVRTSALTHDDVANASCASSKDGEVRMGGGGEVIVMRWKN